MFYSIIILFLVTKLRFKEGISNLYFMEGRLEIIFWTGVIIVAVAIVFMISTRPCIRAKSFIVSYYFHQLLIQYLFCLFSFFFTSEFFVMKSVRLFPCSSEVVICLTGLHPPASDKCHYLVRMHASARS